MLRIRLRRTGAKKQPRYRVVVADQRAPRDGAFVDSIGYYDPLTEPSTIHIDRESALSWLSKGAQPSDRVEKLFRKAGIIEGEVSYPEPAVAAAVATAEPAVAAPVATPEPEAAPSVEESASEESADDGTSRVEQ
jgi:small subunit ribosomal protein S16